MKRILALVAVVAALAVLAVPVVGNGYVPQGVPCGTDGIPCEGGV